jgi:ABC-2 type transport system ATP-binding protein
MMDAIDIRSMSRTFRRSKALDDVTVTVPAGSVCGLLGHRASGKTTLMSVLAGQDRPTSGTAHVFGENPFENGSALSKTSFVRDNQQYPDDYRLHHLLRIAPKFAPNWNTDVAAELIDGFRIPSKTPIRKFSRGQLSSMGIVLALASRAELTLLDEPYLGLDVAARALFHDALLREQTAHPRTVVLSTHLIKESQTLFDRVIILDRGRVRVDSVSEEGSGVAFTVNGPIGPVERLSDGRTCLLSREVGSLKSVTISGVPDDDFLAQALALGVDVSPTPIHELVAAFGTDAPPPLPTEKGAPK